LKRNISVATLALIYRTSAQKRITDGRYTAAALFICSLIFWGAGALFDTSVEVKYVPAWALRWLADCNVYLLLVASLLFSLLTAFLMASYVILERRVSWQLSMLMFVSAVAFNVQPDASAFISMLLPVVVTGLLFRCDVSDNVEHELYALFAITTTFAFFFPQIIILLPLLLLYPALCGKLSARSFFASLLGVATPLWVVAALIYLFPSLSSFVDYPSELFALFWQTPGVALSPAMLLLLFAEFVVAFPAMMHFFVTGSIGRTYLRRRMIFCVVSNVVLWVAGWLCPELLKLFFVWRLPVYSLLSAYVFSALPIKLSNVYIILSLLLWAASIVIGIWIG
jgi:hypothetical protein